MRKTAQRISQSTGALVNVRKTHRNDACPCGQKKIISYPGTDFPDRETPVKFKDCCLSEMGEQAGTTKSSEQLLKEKREHAGWPMRDYLHTPVHQRRDVYQRGGFAPRTASANNNRKRTAGRQVYHDWDGKLLGTSVMIAVGSPKGCIKHGTVNYETIQIGKATQVANRLAFIPFEYKKGAGKIGEQIKKHRTHAASIVKDHAEQHGWRVHLLEKWTNTTKRINLSE